MKTFLNSLLFLLFGFTAFAQCLPVASYPFNGNAADASGNNNHGILGGETANPILTTDRFGNANSAYQFGGYYNKNWIKIPNSNSLKFTSKMSVSLWFKQCTFGGMDGYGNYAANGYFILMSKAGDGIGADPGVWMFSYTDAQKVLHVQYSNTNGYPTTALNFAEDTTLNCFDNCEWVHCVVVINNNLWQMYLNGRLRKQKIIAPADFTKANAEDMYLGRMWGTGVIWYPFNGVMDDVNVYNCALTQADVTTLYGNYQDPLSPNNTILIDSLKTASPSCQAPNTGSVSLYPNGNNAPYQFSKDGGATYQTTGSFANLSPGAYNLRIKSNCTQWDSVFRIGKPMVQVNRSAQVCEGKTFWAGGAYQSAAGVYYDTVKTNLTCDTVTATTLAVKPRTYSTTAKAICNGQSFWGHNATGVYSDTLAAVNGCDSIRTLQLTVSATLVSVIDKAICTGQTYLGHSTTGTYIDTLVSSGGCDSIRKLNLTVSGVIASTINKEICRGQSYLGYSVTGTYTDTVRTTGVCDTVRRLTLTVVELPTLDLGADKEICNGQTVVLSPGNFSTYLWQDSSTQKTFTLTQPGVYSVTVSNSCGVAQDMVVITGKPCNVYFPSAFTPNRDGKNEAFKTANPYGITAYSLKVFNRWGQIVFSTTDPTKGWDGRYAGTEQPNGVFAWIASGVDAAGAKFSLKGTVAVIR